MSCCIRTALSVGKPCKHTLLAAPAAALRCGPHLCCLLSHSHAQPLASSMVSARSAVVLSASPLLLLRSLRTSLASMLMLATSLTMQATFSLLFSSRYRSRVVLPVQHQAVDQHMPSNNSPCRGALVLLSRLRGYITLLSAAMIT